MITFKEHAIQNAGIEVQTVDARELHKFLGVGRDFSNWIKGKIVKYNFVENQHFTLVRPNGKASHGGQNRIDYYITYNMAMQLSMLENSDKGREARLYFIRQDEKARSMPEETISIPLEKDDLTKTIEETYIIEANTDKIKIIKKFLQSFGIKETKENIIKVYHDSTYFMKNHSEYLNEKDDMVRIEVFCKNRTEKVLKSLRKKLKRLQYIKNNRLTKKGGEFGRKRSDVIYWKESFLKSLVQ